MTASVQMDTTGRVFKTEIETRSCKFLELKLLGLPETLLVCNNLGKAKSKFSQLKLPDLPYFLCF